jgi:DNA-directed RNA polymerase subunit M/transcription elongation factor TFIIS
MGTPGTAQESLRLSQHYRRLSDEELIELAGEKENLTEAAQRALVMEISSRKLSVLPSQAMVHPVPPPASSEDDLYAEDRELVQIRTLWSKADAQRLQYVLNIAGIPFYMGKEMATSVDEVISNFAEGVPVSVMRIGWPWAWQAMQNYYFPKDERPEPNYADAGEVAIHCPRCRSREVIFEHLVETRDDASGKAATKYRWTCADCGNHWEDDGVETK